MEDKIVNIYIRNISATALKWYCRMLFETEIGTIYNKIIHIARHMSLDGAEDNEPKTLSQARLVAEIVLYPFRASNTVQRFSLQPIFLYRSEFVCCRSESQVPGRISRIWPSFP